MDVVVANVKCNPTMPQGHVEHDISLLARLGGVWFGSEIEIARYTSAWVAILRRVKATTYNATIECPITLKDDYWDVESHETVRTHKGRKFVTPARYLSVVKAKRDFSGNKVAFVATHYVSGGWHKGFKAFKGWRRQMWGIHHIAHIKMVAQLVDEGYDVVTGGDFNRLGDMTLHPRAVPIAVSGLDHLYAIPAAGHKVEYYAHTEIIGTDKVYTDHPVLVGHFHFVPA